MPILRAQADLNPPDLFERMEAGAPVPSDAGDEPAWWCLHTKPRQEKATARKLLDRRIEYYLPQAMQETRTPKGRRIRSMIPLFPGYVFMRGDDQSRLECFRTETLVHVLPIPNQAVFTQELRQIHRLACANLPLKLEPTYQVGARVRVSSGSLQGAVGIVVRRAGRDRFLAQLQFLGQGVSADLHDFQVEPVD